MKRITDIMTMRYINYFFYYLLKAKC